MNQQMERLIAEMIPAFYSREVPAKELYTE